MTARPKLLVWGAGGQATVVADIVRERGEYEVVGFLDDINPDRRGAVFCDAFVLGGLEQLDDLRCQGVSAVTMAFGRSEARERLGALARSKGFELASAVHPKAIVAAGVRIGAGTVIKAAAVIDPGVDIGENVIIGSCVSVGHHSVIEDGARLNGSAAISGHVKIGRGATIGTGARVRDRTQVGAGSLVGMGAVVVADIPDRVIAYGVPATVRRPIVAGDL